LKVLLAPDKFKGSFSADEVAELLATGIRETAPKATIVVKTIFDGGEGTAEAIASLISMDSRTISCENIAGQTVNATVHWLGDRRIALVGSSQILRTELPWTRADFLKSSSWVLGKLILRALELRPKELWITCGGTASPRAARCG
jgi:glycerate kinase